MSGLYSCPSVTHMWFLLGLPFRSGMGGDLVGHFIVASHSLFMNKIALLQNVAKSFHILAPLVSAHPQICRFIWQAVGGKLFDLKCTARTKSLPDQPEGRFRSQLLEAASSEAYCMPAVDGPEAMPHARVAPLGHRPPSFEFGEVTPDFGLTEEHMKPRRRQSPKELSDPFKKDLRHHSPKLRDAQSSICNFRVDGRIRGVSSHVQKAFYGSPHMAINILEHPPEIPGDWRPYCNLGIRY
ncbi:unnamed protein product [Acanthoscelides obtectus]|uniref:Uncharacterized protein n=1 Tax=Acanthoscelides obtectus TaxID=200917 RepID=A0A9P0VRI6_ACAOB|nr:unnamed protein product [Acanthoscelides obtectus]CAH2021227.1 unnamed protein product [Acanthoscelides obtectus]CAK1685550.1 hypothetical protein AOBTE_LOCUS35501 [Acanthoscelides obtectus]CAK1689149.1 hypothetical protein AOBTE_LOCUS37037 [Acanthoscelides obtectus]